MKIFFPLFIRLIFLLVIGFSSVLPGGNVYINAQGNENIVDTTNNDSSQTDKINISGQRGTLPDSLIVQDTLSDIDTAAMEETLHVAVSKDALEAPVVYSSRDSFVNDVIEEKIYLYGDAKVNYTNIDLEAEYIIFDLKNKLVIAEGVEDSTGRLVGRPNFKEGDQTYRADRMVYNFDTKKGKIYQLLTKEGEGYIHSEEVKKDENNNMFAKNAMYTTCNLDHPHFWIEADPLKIIPDQVLVCGPTNLIVEGVRTPLVMPFAIFPIKKGQRSGILPPTVESSGNLGFGLVDGGYYFGVSDNFDLALRSSFYTSGSWRLKAATSFVQRYRYRGNMNINFGRINTGDIILGNREKTDDFSVVGSFNLDPKAWPNNTLNASINFQTSNYNTYNAYEMEDRFRNIFSSTISYSKNWPGKPYNFNASLRQSQNTQTHIVKLEIPTWGFNVSRINPFERPVATGGKRWYENIYIRGQLSSSNELETLDSLVFKETRLEDFVFGAKPTMSIGSSNKILKYFNLSPTVNLNSNIYTEQYNRVYDPHTIGDDTVVTYVRTDTVPGFYAPVYGNASISLNTKLYGRLQFKKSKIKVIRHVLTPTVSFNYRPDFGNEQYGYYGTVQKNEQGETDKYFRYPTALYGTIPTGRQGGIALSFNNNLEMKVFSAKDTVNQERKIKLLESFSVSSFYNMAVDTFNINPIRINGRTTLFEKIRLNFGANYDVYAVDENNQRINRYHYDETGKPLRLQTANLSIGGNFNSKINEPRRIQDPYNYGSSMYFAAEPDYYINYNVPWDVGVDFILDLDKGSVHNPDTISLRQSVRVNGQVNITPKWRVSVSSGYDFVEKDFIYTKVDLYRDLHCWEMRFSWIPFGSLRSYNFGINVKSTVLKDLKIEKKSSPYDNPLE